MVRSKDKTDQRFIDFFKASQAWVHGAVFKDFTELKLDSDTDAFDDADINASIG